MYNIRSMNKMHLEKISVQTREISQHQFSNMETAFFNKCSLYCRGHCKWYGNDCKRMPITLTAKPLDARAWLKKILHDVAFALIRSVDGGLFGVSWAIDWRLNPKLSRLRKLNYWSRIAIVLRERNRREEKKIYSEILELELLWMHMRACNLAESYINVKFDNSGLKMVLFYYWHP